MSDSDLVSRRSGSGKRLPPLNTSTYRDDTQKSDYTMVMDSTTGAIATTDKLAHTLTDAETDIPGGPAGYHADEKHTWSNQFAYMHARLASSPAEDSAYNGPMKNTVVLNAEANKPRFLHNLENYLVKELDSLAMDGKAKESKCSHESRLQAHREVFQYLIEDFRSYRPLLSSIKNEYEMVVKHQTDYIKQLEPLQQMQITVTQQCDIEIMKLRDKQNAEVDRVKQENAELQSVIDGIRNEQFALETQVQRLNQRLAEQYDRYRSEADARKLLVSEINDLKNQQEELLQQQREASNKDKSEDPVVIRQSLKEAREQEKSATDQINYITANYGDVLPKQDYLSLKEKYSQLQTKVETKTTELEKLKAEHDELLDTHRQVIKVRDELYQESERLRQTATPRPDWNRCTQVVVGGVDRWQALAAEKSSDQLVSVLLNELAGTGTSAKSVDFFDGLGMEDEVPDHLKYEGQVKNRRISRRDAALLIKDIWRERDNADSQDGGKVSLSRFVMDYLKSKFAADLSMAHEWSYNLDNACQKYTNDDKITMFYSVLTGKMDEKLYFIQLQYIVTLLRLLTRAREEQQPADQSEATSAEEARLSSDDFKQVLDQYFNRQVSDELLERLVFAAQQELKDPEATETEGLEPEVPEGEEKPLEEPPEVGVEFMRLFFEDDEGKFGPFIDELKKQLEVLREEYIQRIIEMLSSTESLEEEVVTPTDLEAAIYNNDTQLEASVIENLLLGTYEVGDRSELEGCVPKSKQAIQAYLSSHHIKPIIQIN